MGKFLIVSALVAFVIIVVTLIFLARNALALFRTGKAIQRRTEPHVLRIQHMAEVVTNRAAAIVEKVDVLQKSAFMLTYSLSRLSLLLSFWQKAMAPVNRARSYLGKI